MQANTEKNTTVKKQYYFNIISTLSDGEQDIFDITLDSDDVKNEGTFLTALFQTEDNLESLIKYSICQKGVTKSEALPYLVRRNGKYYFNDEYSELVNFRNKFLKKII